MTDMIKCWTYVTPEQLERHDYVEWLNSEYTNELLADDTDMIRLARIDELRIFHTRIAFSSLTLMKDSNQ